MAALQRLLAEHCQSSAALAAAPRRADSSRGRVYVIDATGCTLADTPTLRDRFAMPAPARAGVSYPMTMVMGLLDLASGLFVRAAVFPIFCPDQRGLAAVLQELIIYIIVYNLVRLLMLRWARISGQGPRRVSFIDALRLLCMRALDRHGVTQLILNPDCPGRRQLRVRRRRPRHFPLLTHPRPEQPDINYYRRRR